MRTYFSSFVAACIALTCFAAPSLANEACRKVFDEKSILIPKLYLEKLASVRLNSRAKIFSVLQRVAASETSGCWSGATGDTDGQLLSLGVQQWNFGQSSLQPLLRRYKKAFANAPELEARQMARTMPQYGSVLFVDGCLQAKVDSTCTTAVRSLQDKAGNLHPDFAAEANSLFSSDAMVQIQMDKFIDMLSRIADDLKRVFHGQEITPRKVMWAIDLETQQGKHFPVDRDLKRMRNDERRRSSPAGRQAILLGAVAWFKGACLAPDTAIPTRDCDWNVQHWSTYIQSGNVTPEQEDLLYLTLLCSRTAVGEGGRWQAIAFERRAKIAFGIGQVSGDNSPEPE